MEKKKIIKNKKVVSIPIILIVIMLVVLYVFYIPNVLTPYTNYNIIGNKSYNYTNTANFTLDYPIVPCWHNGQYKFVDLNGSLFTAPEQPSYRVRDIIYLSDARYYISNNLLVRWYYNGTEEVLGNASSTLSSHAIFKKMVYAFSTLWITVTTERSDYSIRPQIYKYNFTNSSFYLWYNSSVSYWGIQPDVDYSPYLNWLAVGFGNPVSGHSIRLINETGTYVLNSSYNITSVCWARHIYTGDGIESDSYVINFATTNCDSSYPNGTFRFVHTYPSSFNTTYQYHIRDYDDPLYDELEFINIYGFFVPYGDHFAFSMFFPKGVDLYNAFINWTIDYYQVDTGHGYAYQMHGDDVNTVNSGCFIIKGNNYYVLYSKHKNFPSVSNYKTLQIYEYSDNLYTTKVVRSEDDIWFASNYLNCSQEVKLNVSTEKEFLIVGRSEPIKVDVYSNNSYINLNLTVDYIYTLGNMTHNYEYTFINTNNTWQSNEFYDIFTNLTNVTLIFNITFGDKDPQLSVSFDYNVVNPSGIVSGSIDVDDIFYRVENVTFDDNIINNINETINIVIVTIVYSSNGSVIFSNNTNMLLSPYGSSSISFNLGQLNPDSYLIVLQANVTETYYYTLDTEQFVVSNTEIYADVGYQIVVQAGLPQNIRVRFTNLLNLSTNETFYITVTGPGGVLLNDTVVYEFSPHGTYTYSATIYPVTDGKYTISVVREVNSTETLSSESFVVTGQLVYLWKSGYMFTYMIGQVVNGLPIILIGILCSVFIYYSPISGKNKVKLIIVVLAITLVIVIVPMLVSAINYANILYFAPIPELYVTTLLDWISTPWWAQLLGL